MPGSVELTLAGRGVVVVTDINTVVLLMGKTLIARMHPNALLSGVTEIREVTHYRLKVDEVQNKTTLIVTIDPEEA